FILISHLLVGFLQQIPESLQGHATVAGMAPRYLLEPPELPSALLPHSATPPAVRNVLQQEQNRAILVVRHLFLHVFIVRKNNELECVSTWWRNSCPLTSGFNCRTDSRLFPRLQNRKTLGHWPP